MLYAVVVSLVVLPLVMAGLRNQKEDWNVKVLSR